MQLDNLLEVCLCHQNLRKEFGKIHGTLHYLFSNNNDNKSILYCLVKLPILVTDKTVVIPSAHLAGASVRTIQKATQEHITITNKGV